jgi:hypothetical protein
MKRILYDTVYNHPVNDYPYSYIEQTYSTRRGAMMHAIDVNWDYLDIDPKGCFFCERLCFNESEITKHKCLPSEVCVKDDRGNECTHSNTLIYIKDYGVTKNTNRFPELKRLGGGIEQTILNTLDDETISDILDWQIKKMDIDDDWGNVMYYSAVERIVESRYPSVYLRE